MHKERGSISIMVLATALFLALVSYALLMYINRTAEREWEYLHGEQLRRLCNSVAVHLAEQDLEAGEETFYVATLYPNKKEVQLTRKVECSTDNTFRYLDVLAQSAQGSSRLRHMRFELSELQREQAREYMFISGKEITGAEYLADAGVEYTSKEEVVMPAISFLKNPNTSSDKHSISELPMSSVKQDGLNKRCYYLPAESGILTFSDNMKVYGEAVIATEGSIVIGKNCHFLYRVVLRANGTITIKEGVVLEQALLMSYGKLSVGANCTVQGVAFCDGEVEILGECTLVHDENVVAPFSSAFYII